MRVIAARLVANAAVIVGLDRIDFDDWFQDFRCRMRVVAARLVTNETIFFYPYSKINGTLVMEEKNHSINDLEIECGLLIFRHNELFLPRR